MYCTYIIRSILPFFQDIDSKFTKKFVQMCTIVYVALRYCTPKSLSIKPFFPSYIPQYTKLTNILLTSFFYNTEKRILAQLSFDLRIITLLIVF